MFVFSISLFGLLVLGLVFPAVIETKTEKTLKHWRVLSCKQAGSGSRTTKDGASAFSLVLMVPVCMNS